MAVAIVGDTHLPKGRRRMPEAGLELLRNSESIVHTGDFTRMETLELFAGLGPPLVAVAGNVDEPAIHDRLPEVTSFAIGGHEVAVIHDAGPRRGRIARMRRRFPEADAVIFGHSHLPLHERADGSPRPFQIFNPGSPTERRRAPRHSMGIAESTPRGGLRFRHVWLD